MKRYLIFYGSVYYPRGGMDDFKGDFDTISEAKSEIDKIHAENDPFRGWDCSWAHIYDTETKTIIFEK